MVFERFFKEDCYRCIFQISQLNSDKNKSILDNLQSYSDLSHILRDMPYNSTIEFSTWKSFANLPETSESFWVIRIFKGSEVGFNYFLVGNHNHVNTIVNQWIGTYGASTGDIVWRKIQFESV